MVRMEVSNRIVMFVKSFQYNHLKNIYLMNIFRIMVTSLLKTLEEY